jgi:plasmid stabilization system protein ParE
MRVRYTPRAFADREAIFEYLDERNPRAAREVKAYIVYYRVGKEEVSIIHIRHAARRPWQGGN